MEKRFTKFLNGTADPNDFSEVLADFCTEDIAGKVSLELLKCWEGILISAIENKENSWLLEKIHHRIALEESKTATRRLSVYRSLLRIAAIFICGLIATTWVLYNRHKPDLYTGVTETVTTPYGARTSFKLSDGSEIWLNSGSTISFPKQFGEIRNADLSGEAYFKVAKDGRPFVVKTSLGTVEVMGTSFNVRSYANENFNTTLVEGSVKVYDRTDQVATLLPGQQSIITSANSFTLKVVDTNMLTSWKEGKLIFEKEPFQNVTRELERWYNVKIELQGEYLKRLGYTGTIEMETFSEVLELIKTTAPIKYKFDKITRILKISGR